jgi:hypothetical protein
MSCEIVDLRTPTALRSQAEIDAYVVRDDAVRQLINAFVGRFPYGESEAENDLREKIFELAMDRLSLAHQQYNQTIADQLVCDD